MFLTDAQRNGFYPIVATHDDRIQNLPSTLLGGMKSRKYEQRCCWVSDRMLRVTWPGVANASGCLPPVGIAGRTRSQLGRIHAMPLFLRARSSAERWASLLTVNSEESIETVRRRVSTARQPGSSSHSPSCLRSTAASPQPSTLKLYGKSVMTLRPTPA